jgi:NADH:ubiquinone oxidoreductase subunit 6 (subunit J)
MSFAATTWFAGTWALYLPALVGAIGVYLLLPRARSFPAAWGAVAGILGLLMASAWLTGNRLLVPDAILFWIFSAIAIVAGVLLITQHNPVHAALSFALVVLSTCGLFLLQAAPFLMAGTVIVYAGAIVVTFLFVIMLAQQEGLSSADRRSREPLLSTLAGFVLLGAMVNLLERSYDVRPLDELLQQAGRAADQDSFAQMDQALGDADRFWSRLVPAAEAARGSPDRGSLEEEARLLRAGWPKWQQDNELEAARSELYRLVAIGERVRDSYGLLSPSPITQEAMSSFSVPQRDLVGPGANVAPLGRSLFTDYLLPVELGGLLLLVAAIGAIAISSRGREGLR